MAASSTPSLSKRSSFCDCEAKVEAASSVIDNDAGLNDESCSVVIIGGGPHALAALAALHEGSLAFQQYRDEAMFQSRVGFNSQEKVGTVTIIDPGAHFMQSWNTRFASLQINHLRSPTFAHPVAYEPTALLNFAIREGRTSELIDSPFVGKTLAGGADMSQQEPLLKALPSSALFKDFCASLEAKLPHRWLSGSAVSVCKDSGTGKYRVHYKATANQRERKVVAKAVILATGPVGAWNIPTPFEPHLASRLVLHTEEFLAAGNGTLSEEITRRCPRESNRVLVIGGGISAAQAALAAYHAGHEVVLRSRRQLTTRPFDIEAKWLDGRNAERLRFEFLSLPVEKRRAAVREAVSGGSVPTRYMEELARVSKQDPDALRIEVDEKTDQSDVCVDSSGEHVLVNGESFAMVILATGVVTAPTCSPLYRSVEELFDAPTVDGLPHVDSFLRWAQDEDLFVLGANAVLELGPGGGNLMGAMRGARIVANELHGLMWKTREETGQKGKGAARNNANPFAIFGEGSDEESDDNDGSDDEQGSSSKSDEDDVTADERAPLPPPPELKPNPSMVPSMKPKLPPCSCKQSEPPIGGATLFAPPPEERGSSPLVTMMQSSPLSPSTPEESPRAASSKNTTPALSKREEALRKARKHRKTTKPKRGSMR